MNQIVMLARLIESLAQSVAIDPDNDRTDDRIRQIWEATEKMQQLRRADR